MAPSRGQSICQTGGAGTHLLEEVREDRHAVRLGHQHGCWSVEDREERSAAAETRTRSSGGNKGPIGKEGLGT